LAASIDFHTSTVASATLAASASVTAAYAGAAAFADSALLQPEVAAPRKTIAEIEMTDFMMMLPARFERTRTGARRRGL